jgi:hypothetical protein
LGNVPPVFLVGFLKQANRLSKLALLANYLKYTDVEFY